MLEVDKYYHLYNRGHNKDLIFFEDANYAYFLKRFREHLERYVNVYAYCLMPNHFHLFVEITNEKASQAFKNFLISYSKSINKKLQRVGSLFQGSLKYKSVDTENYFTRIITYIHQNPLESRLSESLKEYKYSSYNAILSDKATLIKREAVLNWFGGKEGFINDHKNLINTDLSSFENLTSLH